MKMGLFDMRARQVAVKVKRALVFGITDDLYFALGTMLVGFFKHNPGYDGSIVVFHESLNDAQQDTLRRIYPDISFRAFTPAHVATRLSDGANPDLLDRYSHMYFAKFELPNLLDDYQHVVWMDVDMLVRGPLDHIWAFSQFCWRPTLPHAYDRQQSMYSTFADQIIQTDLRSPNAGLIGLGRDARKNADVTTAALYRWFSNFRAQIGESNGDEFAYFMLAATTNAEVTRLPLAANCPAGKEGADTAEVIHTIGTRKFWNCQAMRLAYPDWWIWHAAWVAQGGAPSTSAITGSSLTISTPNEIVRCASFQETWSELYNAIWKKLPDDVMPSLRVDRRYWKLHLRHWPKRFLSIKTVKHIDGTLLVGVHLNRTADLDTNVVNAVTEQIAKAGFLQKEDTATGIAWVTQTDNNNLARDTLRCARLISGLPYRT